MLHKLNLFNFKTGFTPDIQSTDSTFILETCQRTIVIGYDNFQITNLESSESYEVKKGKDAYLYLLEITCGLKSKLLGENEIVGQFKKAYKDYISLENRCNKVLSIIEKLFKDTKEIRTKYLIGLGQKTYASIARREIYNKHKAQKVLILGSGQMAEDLINQFKKKCDVYLCARNTDAIENLKLNHEFQVVEWGNYSEIIQFSFIANTIGSDSVIFNEKFFEKWSSIHLDKAFIDLGSPSVIDTTLDARDGVMRLEDIFNEGAVKENHKKAQIKKAKNAMDDIVEKRHLIFQKKKLKHKDLNYAY